MKHETTTLMTKTALVASLKKLMEKKSLNKISVRDIIEECGVNRKTFYYHFQDIYDLVRWMLEIEAIEIVKKYDLIVNYKDAVRFAVNYIEKNKHICSCAFDALGRDELKRFLYKDFIGIFGNIIEKFSEGISVSYDYKVFLVEIYTETFASFLIDLIRSEKKNDKEKMIKYITFTLFGVIKPMLEKAAIEFK